MMETKWQKIWKERKTFETDLENTGNPYYVLTMFPYPSGKNLHIGHWFQYGVIDSWAKFQKLKGKAVFQPMGFDSFGLPAENYAIKNQIHPEKSIRRNIDYMIGQFETMGAGYSWRHKIETSDHGYYRWTQWLFLVLYKRGLAYRKKAPVNWCPSCRTVLANEQVKEGQCERCATRVLNRELTQWFFKITAYVDELLRELDGLDWPEETKAMQRNWIGRTNIIRNGKKQAAYRLHDWLISRQRYWGAPIPIIYCPGCGEVPVPEEDLPVLLPSDVCFSPEGESPLKKHSRFMNAPCPVCGKPGKREPDTMDTFVCSSWYFLRFPDPGNRNEPFSREKINSLLPVDLYCGGREHACMHLLYARFITKVLRDAGYIGFGEPFKKLIHQGMILGSDGKRMSKSRGALSPDSYVRKYGADTLRAYMLFAFNYTEGGKWSENGIPGVKRFISRADLFIRNHSSVIRETEQKPKDHDLYHDYNKTVDIVTENLERFSFNTATARMMEFINILEKYGRTDHPNPVPAFLVRNLIIMMAPFAPHHAEE
ncbi:MAG: class I tRNA ligase family protein, partial [Spirochaetia bacterium]